MNSELFYSVLLPIVGTFFTGVFMFWLGAKKRSTTILSDMEGIVNGLVTGIIASLIAQLKECLEEKRHWQRGVGALIKQIEELGEDPVWRPDETRTNIPDAKG